MERTHETMKYLLSRSEIKRTIQRRAQTDVLTVCRVSYGVANVNGKNRLKPEISSIVPVESV